MDMRRSTVKDTGAGTVLQRTSKEKKTPLPMEVAAQKWKNIEHLKRQRMKKLRELRLVVMRDGVTYVCLV